MYKTNLCRLSIPQNKAMRIICHVKPWEIADPLYTRIGIMKFTDINPFLIGRCMHRCCHGKAPEIFVSYFQQNCDVHHYDTRTAQHFHIKQVKFDLAKLVSGIEVQLSGMLFQVIIQIRMNQKLSLRKYSNNYYQSEVCINKHQE